MTIFTMLSTHSATYLSDSLSLISLQFINILIQDQVVLAFTLAMLIEQMLSIGLTVELYFKCVGNRTLVKSHTWDDIIFRLLPIFVMYLAAVVTAAVQFAQAHGHTAIEKATWDVQDLPMTLTMTAYVARFILSGLRKFTMHDFVRMGG
jgi:hypothetical protein